MTSPPPLRVRRWLLWVALVLVIILLIVTGLNLFRRRPTPIRPGGSPRGRDQANPQTQLLNLPGLG